MRKRGRESEEEKGVLGTTLVDYVDNWLLNMRAANK